MVNKGKIISQIKYWAQALLIPVHALSYLVPRNKRLWVIGTTFGNRWADNGRYFYLYLQQHRKNEVQSVFITRKKEIAAFLSDNGYEAYYVRSLKGIITCLRAGVYVYDNYTKDICYWTSGGACHINMWHGSGNKKTNYDNKFDTLRYPKNAWDRITHYLTAMTNEKPGDYTVATSPMMKKIFVSAFRTDEKHIIVNGYPRNDVTTGDDIKNLLTMTERSTLRQMRICRRNGGKVLVYMPTFRASESKFFDVMNLKKFNRFLEKENLFFFTKMHPKSKVKEAFDKINGKYARIINIDADVDPYTFLREVDMLVTDYSSIYSDYLLLDRPSVLFPYDFEEYSNDTRECYFTYENYMPEIRAHNMKQLMEDIKLVLELDNMSAKRKELRDRIFSVEDGHSSERLFRKICKLNGIKIHNR